MVISMVMSMSMLTLVAAGRAGFYFLQAQQAIRYLAMHSKVSSTVNITVYSTVQCTVMDHTRIVYSTVTVRCPVQQSTAIVKATLTDLPESKIQALSVRGDVGQLHVKRVGGHLHRRRGRRKGWNRKQEDTFSSGPD